MMRCLLDEADMRNDEMMKYEKERERGVVMSNT